MDQKSQNHGTRSGQNSVQAIWSGMPGVIGRLSPSIKKRNIKGQMSSQMNKTTSQNEVKKIVHNKSGQGAPASTSLKSKNFYKTMLKPQSFIAAVDN